LERTDLPLDLIVVADLVPPGSGGEALRARAHRVDRESLAELLAQAEPGLELPPPGASDGAPIRTRIAFGNLRAFRPEGLAAALPATRGLFDLKRAIASGAPDASALSAAIESIREPPELAQALRRALEGGCGAGAAPPGRPAASSPATSDVSAKHSGPSGAVDPIESVFEMVDVSGRESPSPAQASRARSALDALVSELLGAVRAPGTVPTAALQQIGLALDRAITDSVSEVLHHPRFQALERSWLSLRWLARRIDFRSGIRLHAVAAGRAELLAAFRSIVLPLAAGARDEGRVPLALLDHGFDLGPDSGDFDDLAEIADLAEGAQLPLVAGLEPTLLGVRSLADAEGLDDFVELLADDDHVRWNALRGLEASRWLALAMNRFLLRPPYGAEQERVKDFAFEENPLGEDAHYLWANPAWAIGALIAASFERTGWGTEIVGPEGRGRVQDLAVRPLRLRTGETVQAPLETLLSERRVLELSQGGIVALACRRNGDQAFLASAPTVHRPEACEGGRVLPDSARRASLPFTLFLAQVSGLLQVLAAGVDRSGGREPVAKALAQGLELMTSTGEGPLVRVNVEAADGDRSLALGIQPAAGPLRGLPAVILEVPWAGS
jgi:type VI secretion system protein ImpC